MLAVNVIIILFSRIPTDREKEKDETKLNAIWERRVLRIPAAWVAEQQMQLTGRTLRQCREGAHSLPLSLSMLSYGVWWSLGLSALRPDSHSPEKNPRLPEGRRLGSLEGGKPTFNWLKLSTNNSLSPPTPACLQLLIFKIFWFSFFARLNFILIIQFCSGRKALRKSIFQDHQIISFQWVTAFQICNVGFP